MDRQRKAAIMDEKAAIMDEKAQIMQCCIY